MLTQLEAEFAKRSPGQKGTLILPEQAFFVFSDFAPLAKIAFDRYPRPTQHNDVLRQIVYNSQHSADAAQVSISPQLRTGVIGTAFGTFLITYQPTIGEESELNVMFTPTSLTAEFPKGILVGFDSIIDIESKSGERKLTFVPLKVDTGVETKTFQNGDKHAVNFPNSISWHWRIRPTEDFTKGDWSLAMFVELTKPASRSTSKQQPTRKTIQLKASLEKKSRETVFQRYAPLITVLGALASAILGAVAKDWVDQKRKHNEQPLPQPPESTTT